MLSLEIYEKLYNEVIWPHLKENTNSDIARVFKVSVGDNAGYHIKDKAFYFFSEDRGNIWVGGADHEAYINCTFTDTMVRLMNKLKDDFLGLPPPMPTKKSTFQEKQDYHDYKEKLEILGKTKAKVDGSKGLQIINKFLPAQYDRDCIGKKLNKNPDLFPCANGVWSFTDNKLYEYKKEHYLSHKGEIDYNPDADTSDIQKAINQWFKYDDEIVDFIHYFIGYILTGYTDRQEFLFIHGQNACNGKSTLWGEILKIILGDSFYQVISSKNFSESTGGAKSQNLYNLDTKRMGHVDEPSEGANSRMDKELIKKWTSGKVSQDAKGLNEKDFDITHKMVFTFNKIPDLDFNDEGFNRRCVIIEQNVKFADQEEYDKAPQSLKDSHSVQLRDSQFIDRLKANKEGLLLWALQGAKKYIDNRARPVPAKLQILKKNVKDDSNELSNWIKRNLQHEPGKNVSLSAIKSYWRRTGDNFGQSKKGFNKLFLDECQKLGFATNVGREQKSEEKVLDCIRVLSEEELQAQAFQGVPLINL